MGLPALHRPGGTGNIAVPFARKPTAGELDRLLAQGADVFELRLDLAGTTDPQEARELAESFAGYPLIATARSQAEGGKGGSESERALLLAATAGLTCAYDVELSSTQMLAVVHEITSASDCDLIASFHHFGHTPPIEDLLRMNEQALAAGADVFKAATRADGPADIAILAQLLAHAKRAGTRAAAMGMGDDAASAQSRVELARAGSCFVYAQAGEPSAPGQPALEWLAGELAG